MPLHPDAAATLTAMGFGPNDHACVSHTKYAYQSVPVRELLSAEAVRLEPNPGTRGVPADVRPEELLLCSVNPVRGPRSDAGVYRWSNFLVEVDGMPLASQREYVLGMGMPFTACVYSGNRSMHFAVALREPLPDESSWRMVAKWMLNVMDQADQQTANPSRMVRLPGALRPGGREQRLVELREPVPRADLFSWLSRWPDRRPPAPPPPRRPLKEPSFDSIAPWARRELLEGIDESRGRSNRWYALGYEFALAGYQLDDAVEVLSRYYVEDRDFKRKEWESCIRHAYGKVQGKL